MVVSDIYMSPRKDTVIFGAIFGRPLKNCNTAPHEPVSLAQNRTWYSFVYANILNIHFQSRFSKLITTDCDHAQRRIEFSYRRSL